MARSCWVLGVLVLIGCTREPPVTARRSLPATAPAAAPIAATPVRSSKRTDLSPTAASLAEVKLFAIGGVGFAGERSDGETLTLALAREPDAAVMFERLATDPNRVARLYAYWALRTLGPARAQHYQADLLRDPTQVETAAGCVFFRKETRELASELDQNTGMPAP